MNPILAAAAAINAAAGGGDQGQGLYSSLYLIIPIVCGVAAALMYLGVSRQKSGGAMMAWGVGVFVVTWVVGLGLHYVGILH